jgi:RNase H-like domain found in reverse transcriptase
LLVLITIVTKWKHYLLDNEFIIKTDQINLKHLLDQKANTALQHKGLSKLLGLHYRIEYKKGTENRAADALSRCEGKNGNFLHMKAELTSFSELIPQWVQDIKASYQDDDWIATQLKKLQDCPSDACHFTIHQGILRYNGRICVGSYDN